MIIGCPECGVRFVVPSTIFMKGGRKLRCSSCKHTWFQEEPMDKSEDIERFADMVHDKTKDSNDHSFIAILKQDFSQGMMIIGLAFLIMLGGYFVYRVMTPSIIMGEGLAFNNVQIEREGNTAIISGEIVNSLSDDRGIPPIKITHIMAQDIKGDSVVITLDSDILHGGETVQFAHTLQDIADEVMSLNVGFDVQMPTQSHDSLPKHEEEPSHAMEDH